MNIYTDNLIDNYTNPRNYGVMHESDTSSEAENVSCGDLIKMQIKIKGGKLKRIKFTGEGCAVAIACSSILTEHITNKSIAYAKRFSYKNLEKIIGIEFTSSRIKCANLGLEALKSSLKLLTKKDS